MEGLVFTTVKYVVLSSLQLNQGNLSEVYGKVITKRINKLEIKKLYIYSECIRHW